MKEIALNVTQKTLVSMWRKEANEILQSMDRVLGELLTRKMADIARELGINLDKENWSFDMNTMVFYKQEERCSINNMKKVGRPRKEENEKVVNAEVIEQGL